MRTAKTVACGLELARVKHQRTNAQRVGAGQLLRRGNRPRFDGVGKREELLRNMAIWVVQDRPCEKVAAVESLLRVSMKPDTHLRAAQSRQDGARARKELQIQNGVEPERAHLSDGAKAVLD